MAMPGIRLRVTILWTILKDSGCLLFYPSPTYVTIRHPFTTKFVCETLIRNGFLHVCLSYLFDMVAAVEGYILDEHDQVHFTQKVIDV